MTKKTISDAITNISAEYIEKADGYAAAREPARKSVWLKWTTLAASVAVAVLAFAVSHILPTDTADKTPTSWFVITAKAAEGEESTMEPNNAFNNSADYFDSVPDSMLRPPTFDKPLFSFKIVPTRWENYKNRYNQFLVTLTYDGKNVCALKDGVGISCLYPPDPDVPCVYLITGWTDDTSVLTITVKDIDTNEIVEETTINIKLQEDDSYELIITNVDTHSIADINPKETKYAKKQEEK